MSETEPVGLIRLDDSDLVLAKVEDDIRGAGVVDSDGEEIVIGRTRAEIAKAPGYDPSLKKAPEPQYFTDIYGYYGTTPFWTPGYRHPGFPFRSD